MCRVRFALPQPTCASAAKELGQTAGRSSTASRARLRWRSCLESTLRPRREPVRTAARRSARALEGAAPQTPSRRRQGHCTPPYIRTLPTAHSPTHPLHTHTHTHHTRESRRSERETARRSGDAEALRSRIYCSGSYKEFDSFAEELHTNEERAQRGAFAVSVVRVECAVRCMRSECEIEI